MPSKSASKTITRDPSWLGPAIHPGEILLEEFLKPLGIGQVEAASRLGVSLNRLNEIVLGKRRVTADTALRLARAFKTSPQFWVRLQADWDLHQAIQRASRARVGRAPTPSASPPPGRSPRRGGPEARTRRARTRRR